MRVEYLDLACCGVEAGSEATRAALAALPPEVRTAEVHVLVVAGTVTRVAEQAVRDRFEALPPPRRLVGYGVCTLTGGPYWDSYAVVPGIAYDVAVPGCPPRPDALAEALSQVVRLEVGA